MLIVFYKYNNSLSFVLLNWYVVTLHGDILCISMLKNFWFTKTISWPTACSVQAKRLLKSKWLLLRPGINRRNFNPLLWWNRTRQIIIAKKIPGFNFIMPVMVCLANSWNRFNDRNYMWTILKQVVSNNNNSVSTIVFLIFVKYIESCL